MQARSGNTVRIHYTGKLTDGTKFDSSSGSSPLEFEIGAGRIIPGLEREIVGMEVGDKKTIEVDAADAYGPRREEAVQQVKRTDLPDNLDLSEGTELQAQDPSGRLMRLRVVGLNEDKVTLDANHPLAGEDLIFEVELVEIAA